MKIIMATHNFYKHVYKVGDSHLVDAFVRMGHQLLYLSGPINLFRLRFLLDRGSVGSEYRSIFKKWARGGVYHNENFLEYHPLSLVPISRRVPLGSTDLALFRNMTLTFPPVCRYIEKHGFAQPDLLLVSQLQMAELLDRVDAKVKILRLTDDVSLFRQVPNKIRILERHAVEKADIVVVTSTVLRDRLSSIRKDVVYIPNAVDYEFYQTADRMPPPEYRAMKGPIAVYIGAIDYWFDVDLVAFLARNHPTMNFVLIGIPRISMKPLNEFKNVHILGARPYSELPRYLWNADIGIIPFKRDPLVDAISPLKLYEYMACGLPVIATRWRELEAIGSPALLVDTHQEFAEALSYVLTTAQREETTIAAKKFAEENSWDRRATALLKIAMEKLPKDGSA